MKQKFYSCCHLLTTFSIVNAIPHQLNKRATTFMTCPGDATTITATITPDPPVAGGTEQVTTTGTLTTPAPAGSVIGFGFTDTAGNLIGTPIVMDLCSTVTCPATDINAMLSITLPADLPASFIFVITIVDPATNNTLGCTAAAVGA
ncbi:hypothetical protein C1645_743773 [Glomus cerebriforme]|uniref:Phosphatidylglycerol/phosphatidylinositol transfer protein n=1 Tax=Glomus cerebriforme TaxID=658196 RepID=A0A397S7X1_9GLOM|nr:hypothetical protein C1645_743773 [Glomus cerebriforme]